MKFPTSPATIELHFTDDRPDELWTALEVEGGPASLTMIGMASERLVPLERLEQRTRDLWEGVNGRMSVVVRPTVETDAVGSQSMMLMPHVPMPIPVIRYLHQFSEYTMPKLYAL